MAYAVYVFDAYGTLFDVHAAVRKHAEKLGPDAQRLSSIWREKQLEYSWVRALMGTYLDFWQLTQQGLDTAFALVPGADKSLRNDLLSAYWELDCYPEVPHVLTDLKAAGAKLAILSNGSQPMLDAAAKAAGLTELFDEIFSVDSLRTFKTNPQVYEMVTTHFRIYPEEISFQSSNRWDIAGATAFGCRTVWINRAGMPDEYTDLAPKAVLADLTGLPGLG
ncbi:haloacid dehalogenase type II [Roseibium denhamense]|uniref:(S)-2-haloacid dehalogenase n=1 Tax=Roseibium denhamense TaxID=76305 RepID=A0ABY1N676_9HYPH|nr:haloacid dehalogenase type II [Roseibium denhamense]MTI06095.1 haloacid dehalogenase type II [Roseibium denhamense]SMP01175.1 2-haloacid dehalogenase [Roseibium denhamense]